MANVCGGPALSSGWDLMGLKGLGTRVVGDVGGGDGCGWAGEGGRGQGGVPRRRSRGGTTLTSSRRLPRSSSPAAGGGLGGWCWCAGAGWLGEPPLCGTRVEIASRECAEGCPRLWSGPFGWDGIDTSGIGPATAVHRHSSRGWVIPGSPSPGRPGSNSRCHLGPHEAGELSSDSGDDDGGRFQLPLGISQ